MNKREPEDLFPDKKELKEIEGLFSVKYGRPIGYGITAIVYANGEAALKVFSKMIHKDVIFKEAYVLACVERAGIDTSRVLRVLNMNGYWVIEMSLVKGKPLLGFINEALTRGDGEEACRLIKEMAELQARMNGTRISGLPDYKDYALAVIVHNPGLSDEQKEKLKRRLKRLPRGDRICHGDLHPNNIQFDDDGKMTAIDWIEVGAGVPACDAARTYLNMNMGHPAFAPGSGLVLQDIYLNAYCTASGVSPGDVMAWTPVHAGMLVGHADPDFGRLIEKFLHFERRG